ncbi:MAG: SMR family transporter [Candidatus Gracilibacteria bacterium]|jgi:multidrug transporter EmrE-like cation transporter
MLLLSVLATALADLAGEIAAKYHDLTKNNWFLWLTIVFFGLAGFLFAKSLRFEGMAITNILWVALSTILVTLVGYFYFKETISLLQWIGIGVILIGLILVSWK